MENDNKETIQRLSEREYKSIIENLTDVYYRADVNGKLLNVSPSCLDVFGYSCTYAIGRSLEMLYHNPNERSEFIAALKTTGLIKNYRTTLLKKDGTEVYIETTASIIRDKYGDYCGVEGIVRDITERKQTEQALKDSEERYRKLVEQSPFAIAIYQDGKFVYINPEGVKTIGAVNEQDLIGMPVLSIVHPDYLNEVILRMELVSKGNHVPPLEEKLVRLDGSIFDAEVISTATTFNHKPAIQVILRNITEHKKALRALKESEERFKQLIKHSFDTIALIDSKGIQRFVSDSCERVNGYKPEELINISITKHLIHPDDREKVNLTFQRIITEGSAGVQYRHKHKNGGWVYLEGFGTNQLDNPFIESIVFNVRDITESKKVEQTLKENEVHLQELNETKDKLFSVIAHDLRSPFNGILGFSELMLNNIQDLNPEDAECWLTQICFTSKQTLNLLDNLLEWAKSQTGQIDLKHESLKLSPIIKGIVNIHDSSAKIKDITLTILQSDDINVFADPNLLNTVLRNLISNAIKFSNIGGTIHIVTKSLDDQIEITIKDYGIGMDEETRRNLFKMNINTPVNGTSNEKGSGIGLILCKEFIEKQGGTLHVKSELNKGSEFRFTLPKSSQSNP